MWALTLATRKERLTNELKILNNVGELLQNFEREDDLTSVDSTPANSTVIVGKNDMALWKDVWNLAQELYGGDEHRRPTRRNPTAIELTKELKQFAGKSTFVCEFPSLQGIPCKCVVLNGDDVYGQHRKEVESCDEIYPTMEDLMVSVETAKTVINRCHDILRRPAKDVLVTVASDLDRMVDETDRPVHAVPIQYGLSGYSLKMPSVRGLLSEACNACEQHDLGVKLIAFDGQFFRNCTVRRRWLSFNNY